MQVMSNKNMNAKLVSECRVTSGNCLARARRTKEVSKLARNGEGTGRVFDRRNCCSQQQTPNIMRALISGLVVAIVLISLTVFGKQILEYPSSFSQQDDITRQRVGSTRVPFTKRDLETSYNQKNEALPPELESHSSWYDSLVSPIASIFGYEETSSDESAAVDAKPQELKQVQKGYVNYLKSPNRLTMQNGRENSIVDRAANNESLRGPSTVQVMQHDVRGAAQAAVFQGDLVNALNDSQASKGDGFVATIDKIKGIDFPFAKMSNGLNKEKKSPEPLQEDNHSISQRDVKCSKNKFDRLIAQKISLNDISRPVITSNGRFDNPFPTWTQPSLVDVFKFMVLESDESNVPKNTDELEKALPVLKPDFDIPNGKQNDFKVTWLGHSTLVIQIDGMNIITDPVFSDRASPMQFFGPKRIRDPACTIDELPKIDAVLISHNHYDHLDADSVKKLNDRFGSDCRWIVPLGLGEFLRSMSVKNYVELDWWQKDCFRSANKNLSNSIGTGVDSKDTAISKQISSKWIAQNPSDPAGIPSRTPNSLIKSNKSELDIYLTPTQHWSRRGVNDVNKSLWGSYVIVSSNGSTFFFGGDTAYCTAFKEISKIFGPMTGAAIPIGAYKPRWFLKYSHVDPHEAVQIHRDLKSMKSIAIHHSTFILSNEPYREPAETLKEVMRDLRSSNSVKEPFTTLKHGESMEFCKNCPEK